MDDTSALRNARGIVVALSVFCALWWLFVVWSVRSLAEYLPFRILPNVPRPIPWWFWAMPYAGFLLSIAASAWARFASRTPVATVLTLALVTAVLTLAFYALPAMLWFQSVTWLLSAIF